MNLEQFLSDKALAAAMIADNKAVIQDMRAGVPYNFPKLANWNVSESLTAVIQKAENSPVMATVTDFDVRGEVVARGSIQENIFSKYPMTSSRQMTEKALKELNMNMLTSNAANNLIVDTLFNYRTQVEMDIMERIEWMFLQLLSSGKYTLDNATNTGGLLRVVDYNISNDHKATASTNWSDPAATTLSDYKSLVQRANDLGFFPNVCYMTSQKFNYFKSSTEFKNAFTSVITNIATGNVDFAGLNAINTILVSADLPPIQIVNDYVKTKSGAMVQAFSDDNIALGYSGNLGTIEMSRPLDVKSLPGAASMISRINETNGIIITNEVEVNPPKITIGGRAYGLPILPQLYNFFYLKVKNI